MTPGKGLPSAWYRVAALFAKGSVGGAISALVCTPALCRGHVGLLLAGRQQGPGDQALPGDASHREAG